MSHTPDLHFVLLIVMTDVSQLPLVLLLLLSLLLSVLELDVGCVHLSPIWVMQLCFGRQHVDMEQKYKHDQWGIIPGGTDTWSSRRYW